ncbi:MAG TPA: YibE/F family protein [Jiangellales bacterium]|nr:YibE/F family protein [Jiangellales bacterium]
MNEAPDADSAHPPTDGAPQTATFDRMPAGRSLRRLLIAVVVPLVGAAVAMLVVLWPPPLQTAESAGQTYRGEVVAVNIRSCPQTPVPQAPPGVTITRCGTVDVALTDGPDAGTTVSTPASGGPGSPVVDVGDQVILIVAQDPADPTRRIYSIIDHQRAVPLLALVGVFVVATLVFARWRGLAALGGLAVSFAIVLAFVVPAIMDGSPPLLVAIVGAAAIVFVVLYVTHGVRVQTTMAVLGTVVSLVITGVAATVASAAAHLSGFADESSFTLAFYRDVDLHGLLLAGIIIGSLGVLDDVTVTQAMTVTELARADPGLSRIDLYRAASRVGRSHIASVINTLVLAYAGASLPLLLLISASGSDLGSVLTGQYVGQEIVRTIVGSLGLITAVPVTTWLAVLAVTYGRDRRHRPRRRPRPPVEPTGAALSAAKQAITDPWDDLVPSRTTETRS